jgi:hypothetical protein
MARRSSPADGPDGATRALVVELTALVLAQLAPDELAVLDDSADEYFADPSAALRPASGDSPLGSGITVAMMTPYLLAASSAVLPVLGAMAGDLGKDVAKDLLKDSVVKQPPPLTETTSDTTTAPAVSGGAASRGSSAAGPPLSSSSAVLSPPQQPAHSTPRHS